MEAHRIWVAVACAPDKVKKALEHQNFLSPIALAQYAIRCCPPNHIRIAESNGQDEKRGKP